MLPLVCSALYLYARHVEPNWILIRKVRIDTGKRLNGVPPLRVAILSDFHYPRYSSYAMVRKSIAKSNQFDPDLVLMLGDFFDKNRRDPAVLPENIGALFGGVENRLGVFGVLGNHDHWFDTEAIQTRISSETPIRLIDNAAIPIELPGTTIYLAGVGDLWSKDADYKRAVQTIPADAPIILLAHNPDVIEGVKDPRILVQFSGHTHGGQVRLPFIGALKVPSKFGNRYCKGLIKTGNHLLYVNSGICSMKNIRFLCPPEVTWVEIY